LAERSLTPSEANSEGIRVNEDGRRRTGLDLLSLTDVKFEQMVDVWPEVATTPLIEGQVKIEATYAEYIKRQQREVEMLRKDEALSIPPSFDFSKLPGLSAELTSKLQRVQPQSIGQAGRIEGMTPAALTLILSALRKTERRKTA
jgi:tRNA uridine 5-carboxymethylaminomethyl modification enzyme